MVRTGKGQQSGITGGKLQLFLQRIKRVWHSQFRGDSMRKLLKRIYLYFKGKEIWDAKMSEHLEITIVSTPKNKGRSSGGNV